MMFVSLFLIISIKSDFHEKKILKKRIICFEPMGLFVRA